MTKTKTVHFISILANFDKSLSKLNLKHGFKFGYCNVNDFVRLYSFKSDMSTMDLTTELALNGCIDNDLNVVFIYNSQKCAVEFNSDTGTAWVLSNPNNPEKREYGGGDYLKKNMLFTKGVKDLLSSLRLFKEGRIQEYYNFEYVIEKNRMIPTGGFRTKKTSHGWMNFSLEDFEIPLLQEFIQETKLPFKEEFLKLSLENFELTYTLTNINLEFLSLMNALEILLKPSSSKTDLKYRLSRNGAVLLGKNREDSEKIYKNLKCLYDIRSSLVHTGKPLSCKKIGKKRPSLKQGEMCEKTFILRGYVRESIKELKIAIELTGKDKDNFLNQLTSYGFGERPWRED